VSAAPLLRSTLAARGYHLAPVVGDARLDQALAETFRCPRCQQHGMTFEAYQHALIPAARGGYIAVAACPTCAAAHEF
jgi:transcription elongation factor Elf1